MLYFKEIVLEADFWYFIIPYKGILFYHQDRRNRAKAQDSTTHPRPNFLILMVLAGCQGCTLYNIPEALRASAVGVARCERTVRIKTPSQNTLKCNFDLLLPIGLLDYNIKRPYFFNQFILKFLLLPF